MQRTPARRRAENKAFLAALARTGNAREAARRLGVHRGTYMKRRARDPAFAAQWDEALQQSQASLNPPRNGEGDHLKGGGGAGRRPESPRTHPADLTPVRLGDGRVQLRRARPGTIGSAEEAAFLRALAASANVRLSAAAAGFAHSSFYARRGRSRAFAREMRLALAQGYEAVKLALLQAQLPEEQHAAAWRLGDNDPPPVPAMTASQALQLLHLHHKTVELDWDKPHRRRRRGESDDTYRLRLMTMWVAEKRREAEDEAVRNALRREPPESSAASAKRSLAANGVGRDRPARRADSSGANSSDVTAWLGHAHSAPAEPSTLPSLDQVTGWSKASGKPPHNPDLALFGGWRIAGWKEGQGGR